MTLLVLMTTLLILTTAKARAGIPAKLAKQARYVASHGGVTGSCHGCATNRMRELARRLVVARFRPSGPAAVATALCVVRRESGFNPGAISRSGDYGLFQINRASWNSVYNWQGILDPVYNVGVGWAMSRRGTSWGPWVVWSSGACG